MKPSHHFTTDATADLLAEAHRIIAGKVPEHDVAPHFEYADWRGAADYAVDGDTTDLAWMNRRQRLFDLWCSVSEAEQARWNDDFPAWAYDVGEPWLANIERSRRAA